MWLDNELTWPFQLSGGRLLLATHHCQVERSQLCITLDHDGCFASVFRNVGLHVLLWNTLQKSPASTSIPFHLQLRSKCFVRETNVFHACPSGNQSCQISSPKSKGNWAQSRRPLAGVFRLFDTFSFILSYQKPFCQQQHDKIINFSFHEGNRESIESEGKSLKRAFSECLFLLAFSKRHPVELQVRVPVPLRSRRDLIPEIDMHCRIFLIAGSHLVPVIKFYMSLYCFA